MSRFFGSVFWLLLALVSGAASGDDRWAFCESCSASAAAHLARSVPPDRFSVSQVHVLDTEAETIRSFSVQVFFDYEFQQWLRLSIPVSSGSAAMHQFAGWQTLRRLLDRMSSEPQPIDIASVASWYADDGKAARDALIRDSGIEAAALQAGSLAASAVADATPAALRFADGSQASVEWIHREDGIDLVTVNAQLSDPAGWPLPADESELSTLDLVGDPGRVDYFRRFVLEAFGWTIWLRDALAQGQRYRIVCGDGPVPSCEITRL